MEQQQDSMELDREIDREEVHKAIKALKTGKAGGFDGITGEMLKQGGEDLVDITWFLLKQVFEAERIPTDWSKGLIYPLFKGGERKNPDNYRGIYLLSIIGKVYTSILNQRLLDWCEKREKFGEEQGGFRAHRATTDQAFILSELVRARRRRKLETHIAFLDIRKAYDTVSRDALWKRLMDCGVSGKMGRVIRSIYQVVESAVILGEELTEWFEVGLGVRQGCTLSPLLFLIFVEGLSQELRKTVIGIQEGKIRLNHLLFADDLALCAGSQQDLQRLLHIVYMYSGKWRFKFNIAKSNVMVVSGKAQKGQPLEYFLGLDALKVVKTYKYLGLDFEDSLRWTQTRQRLVAKAKRRTAMLSKALSEGLSLKAAETIWWSMIVPVLNFGAELWGSAKCKEVEAVQLEVGKRLLGVSRKMASPVVRGELGWWSMRAQRDMKLLLYWARLVRLEDSRLAKQVYRCRREQVRYFINDWCSQVHNTLGSIGLGHIWDTEEVGSEKDWKSLLKASIQAREEKVDYRNVIIPEIKNLS
jgi:hypothetical protein